MRHFYTFLTSLSLSISTGYSAITWAASNTGAYTAGTSVGFVVRDPLGPYAGIQMTGSVDVDGTTFYSNGANNGQVGLRNTTALNQGDSITFTFNFNMQLASGPRYNTGGLSRAATQFRVIPAGGTGVDVSTAVTMGGGNDTLQNYFGGTPTVGDQEYINSGILNFNNSADASVANAHHRASFASFSNGGNTVNLTEATGTDADTTQFAAAITDPGRGSKDLSFNTWSFTLTNDSTTPIGANTLFIFTFEGANLAAQLLAIPEPTTSLLLASTLLGLFRRRR